jgi:ABC-2 type transport system permease protein
MKELFLVEWYKLWRQRRTYYALIALLLIEAIVLLGAYLQGKEILELVLSGLRESFYFQGNLLNGNLVTYFLLNSLWFHVPLIVIIVVSGLITSEFKDGTLQTVLMQPVQKWQFLLSKYLVGILFTVLVVVLLAASSLLLAYALFGTGDLVVYLDGLVFFEHNDALYRLVGAFGVGSISMVFFSVVSLTLGVLVRDPVQTWIVTILFLVLCNILMKLEFPWELVNQLFFAKLSGTWQLFFHSEVPITAIAAKMMLQLLYSALAMVLGIAIFQKKEVG